MSEKPKHTKITNITENEDGTLSIESLSYFEELASAKQMIVKKIKTSKGTFLADLVSCVDVITNQQTRELTLKITNDEFNKPATITKTWTIKKDTYKKR